MGDINFYLEQRKVENMREIEKKDIIAKTPIKNNKNNSFEEQKQRKSLQNRLNKIENQIQQLEKQIKKDDLLLAENYEKLSNDASFFSTYQTNKNQLQTLVSEWDEVYTFLEK